MPPPQMPRCRARPALEQHRVMLGRLPVRSQPYPRPSTQKLCANRDPPAYPVDPTPAPLRSSLQLPREISSPGPLTGVHNPFVFHRPFFHGCRCVCHPVLRGDGNITADPAVPMDCGPLIADDAPVAGAVLFDPTLQMPGAYPLGPEPSGTQVLDGATAETPDAQPSDPEPSGIQAAERTITETPDAHPSDPEPTSINAVETTLAETPDAHLSDPEFSGIQVVETTIAEAPDVHPSDPESSCINAVETTMAKIPDAHLSSPESSGIQAVERMIVDIPGTYNIELSGIQIFDKTTGEILDRIESAYAQHTLVNHAKFRDGLVLIGPKGTKDTITIKRHK
ncbi:hypothetical protein BJ138DRAFT_1120350 [Hygrophoropsis aurantiaca]|uniref:Uncharacterized protein n=1 Tax=Hygrophoropsis aurantiaca TaxID=72124 RepID=A0ACB7ZQP4_9AGAM|nr:hypothetical protein BJ138DRAFT_1120350 [Hygrophoropsis aurantiaca]